jgi:predicted nucleic acid-binding Zn ribbon protein
MKLTSLQAELNALQRQPNWRIQRQLQQICTCWIEIVGSVVAAQTRPVAIQRQVLHVSVSSPGWAQNLAFERRHILSKLNTRFVNEQLVDIRFSTAGWTRPQASSPPNTTPFGLTIPVVWSRRLHPHMLLPKL